MHRRRAALLVLASAAVLVAAPAAYAHFAFVPSEAPARSFARLQLQVPNEEAGASTVSVALEIPEDVRFVRVPPTPGWQVEVEREPLDEPLLVGDRRVVEERITVVTWSGGEITGSNSQSFALRLAVPRAAGQTLAFRATQTYSDDQVVEWIGEPGSENPAPLLTITRFDPAAPALAIEPAAVKEPPPPTTTEEETETGSQEEAPDDTETTAAAVSEEDDDGVSAPLLVALALGIAALFAAGVWLLTRRRAG